MQYRGCQVITDFLSHVARIFCSQLRGLLMGNRLSPLLAVSFIHLDRAVSRRDLWKLDFEVNTSTPKLWKAGTKQQRITTLCTHNTVLDTLYPRQIVPLNFIIFTKIFFSYFSSSSAKDFAKEVVQLRNEAVWIKFPIISTFCEFDRGYKVSGTNCRGTKFLGSISKTCSWCSFVSI